MLPGLGTDGGCAFDPGRGAVTREPPAGACDEGIEQHETQGDDEQRCAEIGEAWDGGTAPGLAHLQQLTATAGQGDAAQLLGACFIKGPLSTGADKGGTEADGLPSDLHGSTHELALGQLGAGLIVAGCDALPREFTLRLGTGAVGEQNARCACLEASGPLFLIKQIDRQSGALGVMSDSNARWQAVAHEPADLGLQEVAIFGPRTHALRVLAPEGEADGSGPASAARAKGNEWRGVLV